MALLGRFKLSADTPTPFVRPGASSLVASTPSTFMQPEKPESPPEPSEPASTESSMDEVHPVEE